MDEETVYGTPIIYGTIQNLSNPTYLGDIYQTILVYNVHTRWGGKRVPFAWENIAGIVQQYCVEYQVQPIAREKAEYCTYGTTYVEKTWQLVFDLQLHDAAVHYTRFDPNLTREENRHGFNLWVWSRQLRKDCARYETELSTLRDVREGWRLQPSEYLLGYLRSLRRLGIQKAYWPARRWLRELRGAA